MKPFKFFGATTELTEIAREIMVEDLVALSDRASRGWDINQVFQVCQYVRVLPITLALVENKLQVVDWLIARGANLNDKNDPAAVAAARNCDPTVLEKLIAHGAQLHRFDPVGVSAYSAALYGDRFDMLPVLLRLGLAVDVDRGVSLRQAVFNGQFEAVRFFIENGMDPNKRVRCMVFPNNPTAVAVAAEKGSLDMVRYLVEHGADISLEDVYGDRPYSVAAANNDPALMEYLKAMEDPSLHDVGTRIRALEACRVPPDLMEFLGSSNRRIELNSPGPRFMEFHDVLGVKQMKWGRKKVVDLVAKADGYWATGFLVWSPTDRAVAHADYEHDQFFLFCPWPEFISAPDKWMQSIFR